MKETTEVELVVTTVHGRVSKHSKRDLKHALDDAAKYDADERRQARVRSRTVSVSRWEWESET